MKVAVTCECGHVTVPDSREELDTSPELTAAHARRFCSQCGRSLAEAVPRLTTSPVDSSAPRTFQQLWQSRLSETEGQSEESPSQPAQPKTEQSVNQPAEVSLEPLVKESSGAKSGRRSLWDVMGGASEVTENSDALLAKEPVSPTSAVPSVAGSDPSKPKGLWSVMPAGESVGKSDTQANDNATAIDSQANESLPQEAAPASGRRVTASDVMQSATLTPNVDRLSPPASVPWPRGANQQQPSPFVAAHRSRNSETDREEAQWCGYAIASLAVGIATVLLAGLSLQPGWLLRMPSLIAGVIALMLGFIAVGDVRRSRGQLTGRFVAIAGVLLGSIGMLLAPLVFARMGDSRRENAGREEIASRLRRIGEALDQHHTQHGHFPPAVVYAKRLDGKQPLHGWMTPLLPFLGHDQIHRRIDLAQPFDAPVNAAAMQQIIPEFVIPTRKQVRSPRGFGLTHFAGVGGEAVNEQVGLMHLGLFAEEGAVRREQITDGLSQTIIVGEIADPLPAWGEPGNFRAIGDGLNKQFHGFGNPTGTGATFLHGDGSVKFYSNKTDRRLLRQLETRDGGEPITP